MAKKLTTFCCGYDRTTPYCPMCGRHIAKEPIMTLTQHIKKYRDTLQQEFDSIPIKADSEYKKGLERRLKKWQGWFDAIEKLKSK